GSGEGGRVTGADVAQAVRSGSAQSEGAGDAGEADSYEDVPHSQIRRVTAQRLLESKQTVPHYYLSVAVRMDALSRARRDLNAHLATQSGPKLSVNDLVIKAAAMALKAVPGVNASWHDDFVRQYEAANVSVAVQTPRGLMVPTVKDADLLGLREINAAVKDLAGRAKEGKLKPEEMSGGTFTVSNLGMFGVTSFSAIINPPQAAILAVGASEKRVVADGKGGFQEAEFMTVTLSCDHRVVDGAMGAQWLQAFKQMLEQPATMLL
ncbi:2-oxoacid dehydrogenases acyltransferase, partial [Helicosporidium sp. ATCC 50920]